MEGMLESVQALTERFCSGELLCEQELTVNIHQFKLRFAGYCSRLPGLPALQLQVQVAQSTLTWCMDSLWNCLEQSVPAPLLETMLHMLHNLQQAYPAAFNHEQFIPRWQQGVQTGRLLTQIQQWEQQSATGSELQQLFSEIIQEESRYNFRQWQYLSDMVQRIQYHLQSNTPADPVTTCCNILLRYNFNHPLMVAWIWQQVEAQTARLETPEEKYHCLLQYQKSLFIHLPGIHPGYASHAPSCGSLLEKQAEAEKNYWQHLMEEENKAAAAVAGGMEARIKTDLSVKQLAYMARLLSEEGIIGYPNHTQLLKLIASVFETKKTENISPESMRQSWYNPDSASKNILKEYLIHMLNRIKK
jgi:hypothetical protein